VLDAKGAAPRTGSGTFWSKQRPRRRDRLEAEVLDDLRHRLKDPDLFKVFVTAFALRVEIRGELAATLRVVDETRNGLATAGVVRQVKMVAATRNRGSRYSTVAV
jgi:hypothetical protein